MNDEQIQRAGELDALRSEVINLRAALRREQDARAYLRVELDRIRAELVSLQQADERQGDREQIEQPGELGDVP